MTHPVQQKTFEASSAITLELLGPCGQADAIPAWLEEVREMRGEVLFANGRRPAFRGADGRFQDCDPDDPLCFHIVARCAGQVVGCTRLRPLGGVTDCMITDALGGDLFDAVLARFGSRASACEAARWMVLPEFRGALGRRLAAATWAAGIWLGLASAFILAGTHDRQDLALTRLGARAVGDLPLIAAEEFDDELRLLRVDLPNPPVSMLSHIREAAGALGLELALEPALPLAA